MIIYYKKDSNPENLSIAFDEKFAKNHNWNYGSIDIENFNFFSQGLRKSGENIEVFEKEFIPKRIPVNLRIKKLLDSSITNVKNFDFSLLDKLSKESSLYEKGRKLKSIYTYQDEVVVEKTFTDIFVDGKLKKLKMKIDWYNEDGTIGLTKTQIVKRFNRVEEKTELRKRRQRAIDYLEASAEEKGFGWIIDLILTNFKHELELFILSGNSIFKDTVLAETTNTESKMVKLPDGNEAPLSYILNQKLPPTELYPEGQTVAEGIIEEIM